MSRTLPSHLVRQGSPTLYELLSGNRLGQVNLRTYVQPPGLSPTYDKSLLRGLKSCWTVSYDFFPLSSTGGVRKEKMCIKWTLVDQRRGRRNHRWWLKKLLSESPTVLYTPMDCSPSTDSEVNITTLRCTHNLFICFYETIKREWNKRLIYRCRCDERLKSKGERSTRLTYTVLCGDRNT